MLAVHWFVTIAAIIAFVLVRCLVASLIRSISGYEKPDRGKRRLVIRWKGLGYGRSHDSAEARSSPGRRAA